MPSFQSPATLHSNISHHLLSSDPACLIPNNSQLFLAVLLALVLRLDLMLFPIQLFTHTHTEHKPSNFASWHKSSGTRIQGEMASLSTNEQLSDVPVDPRTNEAILLQYHRFLSTFNHQPISVPKKKGLIFLYATYSSITP